MTAKAATIDSVVRHDPTRAILSLGIVVALMLGACTGSDSAPETADVTIVVDEPAPATADEGPATTEPATEPPPVDDDLEVQVIMVGVELPDYPYWPGTAIVEDRALLDEFAVEYVAEVALPIDELEMPRFLYGWLPVRAFDRIFESDDPAAAADGLLWLFHVSGYFGGVWLRGELDAAQPGTHNVAEVRIAPDEAAFRATADRAEAAVGAATGFDADVLAWNEASLFPTGQGTVTDGQVDNFGYNQGYMLEILESPPEGLTTPEQYEITCDGPLSCAYASPKLAALSALADVEASLATGTNPAYADLAARIQPVQDEAVPRGRGVWSGLLSVQGFPQAAYDQLLDISSSFLEDVQATALVTAKAVAEGDPSVGRTAAIADAAMVVWLAGYTAGLIEGRDAADVPTFSIGS